MIKILKNFYHHFGADEKVQIDVISYLKQLYNYSRAYCVQIKFHFISINIFK